jgi:4-hydroxy-tetrahydrodipicolinate reductase
MIKVIMNGCNGHMGRVICDIVKNDKDAQVVAGVDVVASNAPFPTFIDINDCDMPADVIIDFSTASAVPNVIKYAVNKKIPVVICTTGLSDETIKLMNDAAEVIPVFRSANMSVGINLLASILKKYSSVLYDAGFDVEILERHHNQKIDAPSGTALLLGDAVNESCDNRLEYVYDRSQVREKRKRNQLGFSAVRGGTIVGDHEVIFAGKDEVIEFTHSAYSKEVFAVGAVKAAKFIVGKAAGKYDMQDVMSEIQ